MNRPPFGNMTTFPQAGPTPLSLHLALYTNHNGEITGLKPTGCAGLSTIVSSQVMSGCPTCQTPLIINIILQDPGPGFGPFTNQINPGNFKMEPAEMNKNLNQYNANPNRFMTAGGGPNANQPENWNFPRYKHEPEVQLYQGMSGEQQPAANNLDENATTKGKKKKKAAAKVENNININKTPMQTTNTNNANVVQPIYMPTQQTGKGGKRRRGKIKFTGSVCPACFQGFTDDKSMRHHLINHELICNNCIPPQPFSNKTELKRHARETHFELHPRFHISEKCPKCGLMMIRTRYPAHIKNCIATTQGEPQCHICKKLCSDWKTVKRHIDFVHAEKNDACGDCGKKFKDKVAFREHMLTHEMNDPKPFKCDQCSVAYSSKRSLNSHRVNKHAIPKQVSFYRKYKKTAT